MFSFCRDVPTNPGDAEWVAQTLPSVEEKKPIVLNGEVAIHSPTTTTSGYIIHQSKRDKWLVVNAQHVASHPYSLVYDENITLGETEAIDVANNIAIIHFRNGKDYSIEERPENGEIAATKEQIDHLLSEALGQKMNWQQWLKKILSCCDIRNKNRSITLRTTIRKIYLRTIVMN